MDDLNRLTEMKRGKLNGSHVIPGTPDEEQGWDLDPVGNWSKFGEAASGTAVLDQTRMASMVNEITSIGTNTVGLPVWATPSYDAAGNMTGFVKPSKLTANLTATYDPWNRLMTVSDGTTLVAAYEYDGLKRRIVKKSYSGGALKETRDFYFSDRWQVLSEVVGKKVDKTYVWGLRYVDELLWRDDSTYGRSYAMQDANFNCTAICDTSGGVAERYQFEPYGARTVLKPSWSPISASAYDWAVAHQGLMLEIDVGLYNCRNRVYSPLLGVWLQRDAIGYADGMNLYEYVRSDPIVRTDAFGLAAADDGFGMAALIAGCENAGSITPSMTYVLSYPRVPCDSLGRSAACNRWASQQCNGRAGCRASSACCSTCTTTAATCCSASGCNSPGSASRCISKGVEAMGKCNSQMTPTDRRKCFVACMAAGMTPACSALCTACGWVAPPTGYGGCLVLCGAGATPKRPTPKVAFWDCVWNCIVVTSVATIEICPGCAGCVGRLTYVCASECGY